jgi:aspartate aminotransferase/aminotransferase
MSTPPAPDITAFLADRAAAVDASGIRKVFDLAANVKDPINFSIGQPDYDVPEPVKRAAIDAITRGDNGYTVTQGIAPLRERITAELHTELGVDAKVLITAGVSGGLLLTLLACVNPGDEVIFLDPYFVSYRHLVNLVGGKPVMVSNYPDFGFPAEKVAAAITDRTKLLLVNSPSNPTGAVLSEADLKSAADLARKHNLLLVTDEIYGELSFDGPCPGLVPLAPERTLLLRGFSKSHGMTGWRLGYAAGPDRLIDEMTKLQQYTFVCAPSIVQHAGLAAMDHAITEHVNTYRRKRDLICDELAGTFRFTRPSGGFYVFPETPDTFPHATVFVEEAIRRNVLIIPGKVFSEQDTHFRISYATDDESIRRGCALLRELAR